MLYFQIQCYCNVPQLSFDFRFRIPLDLFHIFHIILLFFVHYKIF